MAHEEDANDELIDRLSAGSDSDELEPAEFDQVVNPPNVEFEQARQGRMLAAQQCKEAALRGGRRIKRPEAALGMMRPVSPSYMSKRKIQSELKQASEDLNKCQAFNSNVRNTNNDSQRVMFEDTRPMTAGKSSKSNHLSVQLPDIKSSRSMENLPAISLSPLPSVHKRALTDPTERSNRLPQRGASALSKSVENLQVAPASPRPPSATRPRSGHGRRAVINSTVAANKLDLVTSSNLFGSGEKLYSPRK